jgi:hypothetical protein
MKTVGDVLARDLSRRIEEIIQVDQLDEEAVHSEITEYVATDRIKGQYQVLLTAIAEMPSDPNEGVGVWISGFFGSGKSSFAKNLGYVISNRTVLGEKAADLFKRQIRDKKIEALIDSINARFPTEVILFDVSKERSVRTSSETLAEVMYTVLLRELDYAEDFDVAELEIELEGEGKLEAFIKLCAETHQQDWAIIRKGAQKLSRASAVLHQMDGKTYPAADTWVKSIGSRRADITVSKFVDRAFDLCARRRPGKSLVFIVDEVGQYVARSTDKIEDLRAIVEQFGKVGRNLLKAKKILAPVWVVVTSQEKLDEVVAALDSQRVELAKLQDRFKHRIDLAPADIREVASRRVLAKKKGADQVLKAVYDANQGQLNAALHLERTSRSSQVTPEDFVQFYPYPPHFMELSIDIMSGIRLQPGAPRQLGGSNRTIIKQAYEMLVSDRTAMAKKPLGALVTLDQVFELVEGNLSTEKQKDISDIGNRFPSEPFAGPVAKALCLMEFVRDLPRTEANIAACLVGEVGAPAPLAEVRQALGVLEKAQFVRPTEEGWKLQTAQEKNWTSERQGISPKAKDRNDLLRESLKVIFDDPRLRSYRYKGLRTFKVGLRVDGVQVGDEGHFGLSLETADDMVSLQVRLQEVQATSREKTHQDDVYWVFALTPEVDTLAAELFASKQMVSKYDQLAAQSRITAEEAACLQDEKGVAISLTRRLREKLQDALLAGTGLFRGVSKDAAALGNTLPDILRGFQDYAVPFLYPKLDIGQRPLSGKEVEAILKAANLDGLSPVFYDGKEGLSLVTKQSGAYAPNLQADAVKEILDHLNRELGYGNRDTRTGKALENKFGGMGYGWDLEIVQLLLAFLLRAGAIEVTTSGQRFESYQDPKGREIFLKTPTFRSALFTPKKPIDLQTQKAAILAYEDLTGKSVAVNPAAITQALQVFAASELEQLAPLMARLEAHKIAVLEEVKVYAEALRALKNAETETCIRIVAGEGHSLKSQHDTARRLQDVFTDEGIACYERAKLASGFMAPLLLARGIDGDTNEAASALNSLLQADDLPFRLKDVEKLAAKLEHAYEGLYSELHYSRSAAFTTAIEKILGHPDWPKLPEPLQHQLMEPVRKRSCSSGQREAGHLTCAVCHATVDQMDSDLAATSGMVAQAAGRISELTMPPETKSERVKVAEFFGGPIEKPEDVEQAVELLRQRLLGLLERGNRIIIE